MHSGHSYSLSRRLIISRCVFVVAILIALFWGWLVHRYRWNIPWFFETPTVLTAYGILIALVDKWFWRMRWCAFVFQVPNLNGVWNGTMKSSHDKHATERQVRIIVRQTWTRISVVLEADESRSMSVAAHLWDGSGSEEYELVYEYLNSPKGDAGETLHAHPGTAHLRVAHDAATMDGDYYTGRDRLTHGTFRVSRPAHG